MSWLDAFRASGVAVENNGSLLPARPTLNFEGGAADNPGANRTDVPSQLLTIEADGSALPQRPTLDFLGGLAADDPANDRTIVSAPDVSVDTIAHLKSQAIPPTSGPRSVVMSGYATALDGGGGLFVWVAGDSAADNGVTIIASTVAGAPAGRWRRVFSGEIDPRWAGAVGDGATDARAAFATCDAIGPMVVPPGTWRFATSLTLTHAPRPVDGAVFAPDVATTFTTPPPIAHDYQRIFGGAGLSNVKGEVSLCWYMLASDGSNVGPAYQHLQDSQIAINGDVVVREPVGTWTWADQPTPIWNNSVGGAHFEIKSRGIASAKTLTGGGRQRLFSGNQHGTLRISGPWTFIGSGSSVTVDATSVLQAGNTFDTEIDMEAYGILTSADGFGFALVQATGPGDLRFSLSSTGTSNTGTIHGGVVNVLGFEQRCKISLAAQTRTPLANYVPAGKDNVNRPHLYLGAQESAGVANGPPWEVSIFAGALGSHGIFVDPLAGGSFGRLIVTGAIESNASSTAGIEAHDLDALILRDMYFRGSGGSALVGPVAVQLDTNCQYLDIEGGWIDLASQVIASNLRSVKVRRTKGGLYFLTGCDHVVMEDVTPAECLLTGGGPSPVGEPFVPLTTAISILGPTARAELKRVKCDLTGLNSDGAAPNRIIVDNAVTYALFEDVISALDDVHATVFDRVVSGVRQRIYQPSAGGTREEVAVDADLPAVAALGATASTFDVAVDSGAMVSVKSITTASQETGAGTSGVRRTSSASFRQVGEQATLATPVTGGFNPKDNPLLDDACDAAFVNGGTASTATWQQGTGSHSPNAQHVVTNQAAAVKDYRSRIEIVRDWAAFNPSMLARMLGATCKGLWLPAGIINSAGAVSAWRDSIARRDFAPTGTVSFAASAGPNSLPAARVAGAGHLAATIPARQQGTILVVGSIGGNAQTMVSLSDRTGAWGGGTKGNVRLSTEIVSPDSSTSREYCERSSTTGLQGGGTGNGITADPGNYHGRAMTWFQGVDGTQSFGANIWRDRVRAANVDKAVVAPMVANTSLFLGDQQGGGFAMTGDIQLVVYYDQAFPDGLLPPGFDYISRITGVA